MKLYKCFIVASFLPAVCGLTADLQPGPRVKKGHNVVFTCTANSRENVVFWERQVSGESWVTFGTDGQLLPPFDRHKRYHMSTAGSGSHERRHTFRISSSQYEDTSFYRCRVRDNLATKQVVLAVCDDPESSICRCAENKGMYDPSCFKGGAGNVEEVHSRYRGTITGLIVCLVLAILIAIGFAAVLGFDCFKRMQAKRKHDTERQQHQTAAVRSGRSPYDESEQLTLDPNETASQTGNTYSNEAFAPSYDDVMSKPASRYSNGYGPKTPDRPAAPTTPRTPGGSQPKSMGATTNPPVATVYNPSNALDPRNLDSFQFPPNGSNYPDRSPAVRAASDYSRGDKSPGNFSVGSGDRDLLKTPYGASPATPRQPYNDVSSALPPPSSGGHYTEPERLGFASDQYPPHESSNVPRASTMI